MEDGPLLVFEESQTHPAIAQWTYLRHWKLHSTLGHLEEKVLDFPDCHGHRGQY